MADERLIPGSIADDSALAYNEMADRLGSLDLVPLLVYIVDLVPAGALPHLIEQFHVAGIEGATLAETEQNQRELIKNAIGLHRTKGTPGAIKRAIRSAGFGEIEIVERPGELKYDGVRTYDGLMTYGPDAGEWATYYVIMSRAVTNEQAELIRQLCDEFAPARCHLEGIIYTAAAIRYNGEARYDGSYNHGSV